MTETTSHPPGAFCWIELGTSDQNGAKDFYGKLFGWTGERGPEEFGGYTTMHKDGKSVAGAAPLMFEGQPPVWTVYLCTDDADKTADLVAEAGGGVHAAPMDVATEGRMALFTDPAGALFGVWQPGDHKGAQIVQSDGALAWAELSSRDKDAAIPFYTSVFGLQPHVAEGYTELQLGGTSVAGCMDMPEMVPAEVPSYWMPYFGAADPAAKAQEVASLGGTVLVPSMEFPGGTFSVVQDPHGSTFGLLHLNG